MNRSTGPNGVSSAAVRNAVSCAGVNTSTTARLGAAPSGSRTPRATFTGTRPSATASCSAPDSRERTRASVAAVRTLPLAPWG